MISTINCISNNILTKNVSTKTQQQINISGRICSKRKIKVTKSFSLSRNIQTRFVYFCHFQSRGIIFLKKSMDDQQIRSFWEKRSEFGHDFNVKNIKMRLLKSTYRTDEKTREHENTQHMVLFLLFFPKKKWKFNAGALSIIIRYNFRIKFVLDWANINYF